MAIKFLTLDLASRQLINQLFNRLGGSDSNIGRNVRTIRRTFKLRDAQKTVDKMEDERRADYEEAVEKLRKKHGEEPVPRAELPKPAQPVSWDDLFEVEERQFTLDDAYISWLKGELEEHDWTLVYYQEPGKPPEKHHLPISGSQHEAIGQLYDYLEEARVKKVEDK